MVSVRRYENQQRARLTLVPLVVGPLAAGAAPPQPAQLSSQRDLGVANISSPHKTRVASEDSVCNIDFNSAHELAQVVERQPCQNRDRVAVNAEKHARWYTMPDWYVAGSTGLLFIATAVLGYFTYQLRTTTKTAVGDAERKSKQQLRAYVNVKRLWVDRSDGRQSIFVKIRNFGQTPAYKLTSVLRAGLKPYPFDNANCVTFPIVDAITTRYPLAPGNVTDIRPKEDVEIDEMGIPHTPQEDAMLAEAAAVWVVGKITYMDAFGSYRTTNVRYYAPRDEWKKGAFIADVEGNDCD